MEVAVQVVERWILARLRNRRFFSLAELNQATRASSIASTGEPDSRDSVFSKKNGVL